MSSAAKDRHLRAVEDLDSTTDDELVLCRHAPLESAREFLKRLYTEKNTRTLQFHAGDYYRLSPEETVYQKVPSVRIRSDVYEFLDGASRWSYEELVSFDPKSSSVNEVLDALASLCLLDDGPPTWVGEGLDFNPNLILPVANGLLFLEDPREPILLPRMPEFFSVHGVDFPYDPKAPEPRNFLDFVESLWPSDLESRQLLGEMMGYLVTGRLDLEKVFGMIGPKRSGRSTLGRILTSLLGKQSVAACSLYDLSSRFGLAGLINRRLAIIGDARVSNRTDTARAVEMLLAISGRDRVSIDRKYRALWEGSLSTRFLVISNELPQLPDASGALASRWVLLRFVHSWLGREDLGLFDRIVPGELSGILNWSLRGAARLLSRGHFVMPASAQELLEELADLGSPAGTFLRECCEVSPEYEVLVSAVWEAWRDWCTDNGHSFGTKQVLSRNLRACLPSLTTAQRRQRKRRVRVWQGIRLDLVQFPMSAMNPV